MQFPKEQLDKASLSLGGILKLDQWQGLNILRPLYIVLQFSSIGISLLLGIVITEKVSPILGIIFGLTFLISSILLSRLFIELSFSVLLLREVFTDDINDNDDEPSKVFKNEPKKKKNRHDDSSNLLG